MQLLFIAQQYLGKTLTPTETSRLLYFYDTLHFDPELIEYLIEYCVSRGHKSIRYIEKVALSWHSEGIRTTAMAKEASSAYSRTYFTVLKALGVTNRNPVSGEVAAIDRWLGEYGFSMELVLEACQRTVNATGKPSFQYADGILNSWRKKQVKNLEDIRALGSGTPAESGTPGGPQSTSPDAQPLQQLHPERLRLQRAGKTAVKAVRSRLWH